MTVNVSNQAPVISNMTFFHTCRFGIMIDNKDCPQIRGKFIKGEILLWEKLLE
jgi:hypothetical protein